MDNITHDNIIAALSAARAEFPKIPKDSVVNTPRYKFRYASLDAIMEAVTPTLSKHGLAITTRIDCDILITDLMHVAGGSLTSKAKIPDGNSIQELGSYLTYLRRYSVTCLLSLTADEDDDGMCGTAEVRPSQARSENRAYPDQQSKPQGKPSQPSDDKADAKKDKPSTKDLLDLANKLKEAGIADAERLAWLRATLQSPAIKSSREISSKEYALAQSQLDALIKSKQTRQPCQEG